MNRNLEVKKAFTDFVEEYDRFMNDTRHAFARKKVLEKLYSEIKGKVLDVATGTGDVAIDIAKYTKATEIEGVDFSEEIIKKARKKARKENVKIKFSVQNVERLNYPDEIFDIVICWLGVSWFTDKRKSLKEIKRVCKKEGKIILLEEEATKLSVQKLASQSEKIRRFEELEEYISIEGIKNLMSSINCKLLKETSLVKIDENHGLVGLIFTKK